MQKLEYRRLERLALEKRPTDLIVSPIHQALLHAVLVTKSLGDIEIR